MLFPKHEASLILTHNDHRSCYLTVAQAIQDGDHGNKDEDWVGAEQRQKAIETNECWTLQWYPKTPVGFNIVSGADLVEVLKFANETT